MMTSPTPTTAIDRVFHALGDPTRLAVVERLGVGPASTSDLAAGFELALPSVMQHLDMLERHDLVRSTKQGRVRTYHLVADNLHRAQGWLAEQQRIWETRLDRLDTFLENEEPR